MSERSKILDFSELDAGRLQKIDKSVDPNSLGLTCRKVSLQSCQTLSVRMCAKAREWLNFNCCCFKISISKWCNFRKPYFFGCFPLTCVMLAPPQVAVYTLFTYSHFICEFVDFFYISKNKFNEKSQKVSIDLFIVFKVMMQHLFSCFLDLVKTDRIMGWIDAPAVKTAPLLPGKVENHKFFRNDRAVIWNIRFLWTSLEQPLRQTLDCRDWSCF